MCVRVCVRAWLSLDRAREATRSRATHGIACALSAATRVAAVAAVVAVAVACVVVACVRVCARVCVCVCLERGREATRDRAAHPQHTRTRLVQRASCAPPPTHRDWRGAVRREQARALAGEAKQRPEYASMG